MAFFGNTGSALAGSTTQDVEVADPPADSLSCLSWSPQADFLAAGSWDNQVRIYEVGQAGQTQGKAMFNHQGPVLSVCWNKEGNKVFAGGADNAARMLDLQGNLNQPQQVAQHDAPIRNVKYVETPQGGILVTGSWDKTVKYWDLRSPNPIATVQLPERCYTLDVAYPLMVVGCADRHIEIINLTNPSVIFKSVQSPLKWQTRVVAAFPQANGFAIGSVEGRVAVQYLEEKDAARNFSFRCHRRDADPNRKDSSLIYAVNDMNWHPVHGTLATCGSDGTVHFWDTDARIRLKSFEPAPGSITAGAFNHTGTRFAYTVAYDWSKGYTGMTPGHTNKIMLHACREEEVKRRLAKR